MPELDSILSSHGLTVLARTRLEDGVLALVGNAGSTMWPAFRSSREYSDGLVDSLDRWSLRVGRLVAGQTGSTAIFPFQGPPWPPFSAWASSSGESFLSPVSMQIHRHYGLWHAYRFALKFAGRHSADAADSVSPCLSCADQPCLQACPVEAFSGNEYRVDQCVGYLVSERESSCRSRGCAARHACPAGRAFAYEAEHARFHMEAFIRAQTADSTSTKGAN